MIKEILEEHDAGRPILVGTTSVEKSGAISRILKKKGIDHNVLNAKHHENEAFVVAQAGRQGAITVSTNMAGRGTDIILGGNPEMLARWDFRQMGKDPDLDEEEFAELVKKHERECKNRPRRSDRSRWAFTSWEPNATSHDASITSCGAARAAKAIPAPAAFTSRWRMT